MKQKLYCPHCGRCLGECCSSDGSSECRMLVNMPTRLRKKCFVHDMKCMKCKKEVYILMEFKEN